MSRVIVTLLFAAGIGSFAAACMEGQAQRRTIGYDPTKPIAARLLPGDIEVFVEKRGLPPMLSGSNDRPSFDEEIESLKQAEVTALIRAESLRSDLIEEGAWIQTTVVAHVDQLVQSKLRTPLGESFEFVWPAGSMRIAAVEVTTGSFPVFVPGEQYLVVLITRPRLSPTMFFRVNAQGVLERLKANDGREWDLKTNLVGRKVSDVVQAVSRTK